MAKRMQDGTWEERVISKSKPDDEHGFPILPDIFNGAKVGTSASSKVLGLLASIGKLAAGEPSPNEEASSSQM